MKPYIEWTKEELVAEKARLEQEFADVKAKGLNLNISRGKPAAAQLDLTEGMLTVLSKNEDTFAEDGTDCRNYGVLTGIPEARKLIGDICEVPAENVIVYGNASLTIMFDTKEEVQQAYEIMKEGSKTIYQMEATPYSSCRVVFVDKFGIRWGIMTEQTEQ